MSMKNNANKNNKLMPEIKINIAQLTITNKVWPISGCIISNVETIEVVTNDKKYLKFLFLIFLLHKITDRITIKKGFNISIGWNRGKKNRSIHLFDPLTSTPIKGTENRKSNEIKKRIEESINRYSLFIDEKVKIIRRPKKI